MHHQGYACGLRVELNSSIAGVGEPLRHVGRHEALELAL